MTEATKNGMMQAANGAKGTYHANGFKVENVKSDNYKNYCIKCGKHMNEHKGFFKTCPK